MGDEPKVEIGFKEIYDKQVETNTTVQLLNQRMTTYESEQKSLRDNLTWMWRVLGGVVITDVVYQFIMKHS